MITNSWVEMVFWDVQHGHATYFFKRFGIVIYLLYEFFLQHLTISYICLQFIARKNVRVSISVS